MTYRECKVNKSNWCELEHWKDDINEMRVYYKCVDCTNLYYAILEESDDLFEIEEGDPTL